MIRAENISVMAGNSLLLDQVSIELGQHELTAIIGPNGAGKTTLMKCLTGSLTANSGKVWIGMNEIQKMSRHELSRYRSVLTQINALTFPVTVKEIVAMGRHPFRLTSTLKHDNEIIDEVLEIVDAIHLKNRYFNTLSGGEQQRCHTARVLAQIWDASEAFLFLDEPTSAMDFHHQFKIFEKLRKLVEENRLGVCLISHDIRLVQKYATKIIGMKSGKLCGHWNDEATTNSFAKLFDVPENFLKSDVS